VMSATENTQDPSAADAARNRRRVLWGTVVSDRMEKTITVRVERRMRHPKYAKFIRKHKKYHAHDEHNEARVGDAVEIVETRPLSKIKRFRLLQVMERAKIAQGEGVEL
jgi:small subunit ribosomal protein S17